MHPLLKDETCNFLAVDFDKQNWNEDVKAFIETCREKNIPAAIERSRSVNGVKEYWIISPKNSDIQIFNLDKDGFYGEPSTFYGNLTQTTTTTTIAVDGK
jgi:Uma2 family endonuclease